MCWSSVSMRGWLPRLQTKARQSAGMPELLFGVVVRFIRHFIGSLMRAVLYGMPGLFSRLLGSLLGLLSSSLSGILSIFTGMFQILPDLAINRQSQRASNHQCNGKYSRFHLFLPLLRLDAGKQSN